MTLSEQGHSQRGTVSGDEPELSGARPKVTIRGMFEAMAHNWPHWLHPVSFGQDYSVQCQACGSTRINTKVIQDYYIPMPIFYDGDPDVRAIVPQRIARTQLLLECRDCRAVGHLGISEQDGEIITERRLRYE